MTKVKLFPTFPDETRTELGKHIQHTVLVSVISPILSVINVHWDKVREDALAGLFSDLKKTKKVVDYL